MFLGNFDVSINDEPLVMGEVCFEISRNVKEELVEATSSDIMFRVDNWKNTFFDSETNVLYERLAGDAIRENDNDVVFEKK